MKIQYVEKRFSAPSLEIIHTANRIIREYAEEGFDLTLRQLYYQFVARDLLPNTNKSYKRLGSIVNDARLAGLIDWEQMVDRTRFLRTHPSWDDPAEILRACSQQYQVDMWQKQKYRPEVWIEKDALVGVIEEVCSENSVPYFSCRGYTSQSEMWRAAMRLDRWRTAGQSPYIIHLGDHDPSGIDMTRDIEDRLVVFGCALIRVERLALNLDQINEFDPPPNPAKITDSRAHGYIAKYGNQSWELDALDPLVLSGIIEQEIENLKDLDEWNASLERQRQGRQRIAELADEA